MKRDRNQLEFKSSQEMTERLHKDTRLPLVYKKPGYIWEFIPYCSTHRQDNLDLVFEPLGGTS